MQFPSKSLLVKENLGICFYYASTRPSLYAYPPPSSKFSRVRYPLERRGDEREAGEREITGEFFSETWVVVASKLLFSA